MTAEKIISVNLSRSLLALVRTALFACVQQMPVEPKVKSSKTCERSLRGVRRFAEKPKSADPTCYNAPVGRKADPVVDAAGLFENQIRRSDMAIYTRLGAPVQIVAAERRQRWWMMKPGRSEVFDKEPTARQLRGAKKVDKFDIWWIKAKQIGAYPDGTGTEGIGKFLHAPEDKTKRGFLDETFFRADDGIREIHDECEMKAADAAQAA
jgi:hypothetical protein